MEEQPSMNIPAAALAVQRSQRTIRRLVKEKYLKPYKKPDCKGFYFKPSDVPKALAARESDFKEARPRTYKPRKKKRSSTA